MPNPHLQRKRKRAYGAQPRRTWGLRRALVRVAAEVVVRGVRRLHLRKSELNAAGRVDAPLDGRLETRLGLEPEFVRAADVGRRSFRDRAAPQEVGLVRRNPLAFAQFDDLSGNGHFSANGFGIPIIPSITLKYA